MSEEEVGMQYQDVRLVLAASLAAVLSLLSFAFQGEATADVLGYDATFELDLGTLPPIEMTASGFVSVASDGSFFLPAGVFATTTTVTPLQTVSERVANIEFQFENGEGLFLGTMTPSGGMPLDGFAFVSFQPTLGFSPLSLFLGPLGVGGSTTGFVTNGSTTLTATVVGTHFQTGQFVQYGITSQGSTFARTTVTGVDNRTPAGAGNLVLVVPSMITTREDGIFAESTPVTLTLDITFVPEPGLMLFNGLVITTLVGLGCRKLRRRNPQDG